MTMNTKTREHLEIKARLENKPDARKSDGRCLNHQWLHYAC